MFRLIRPNLAGAGVLVAALLALAAVVRPRVYAVLAVFLAVLTAASCGSVLGSRPLLLTQHRRARRAGPLPHRIRCAASSRWAIPG